MAVASLDTTSVKKMELLISLEIKNSFWNIIFNTFFSFGNRTH